MKVFNYQKWNIIVGWLVFLVALITYTLTVEPTASFWDAGEYISTSAKLQVGHPPGAPLYQMIGAFFAIFSFGNPEKIALCVNMMSVIASAFTILFMFWSISYLIQKLILLKNKNTDTASQIMTLGSAAVGALAFTYTDSFWFNAVEAEVYAMASFILSLLFYLGLRWEKDMHQARGNRWLILISFIVGLSFGVHFMGLLTIPAIGFLYYFKNYHSISLKSFAIANVIVVAILMCIFKLLLPYTLTFFGITEVFFVNSLGLPFNSGTIFCGLLFAALFYFSLRYTTEKGYVYTNTLILCVLFIFIGFSSWIMLPIRANAGTVINENNPNNARELLAYYNREQYQETHLFYGPQFSEIYSGLDPDKPYLDDKPKYEKDLQKKKYIIVNQYKNAKQNLDDAHKAILPRMWSSEHAENYMRFTNPLKFTLKKQFAGDKDLQRVTSEFMRDFRKGKLSLEEYNNFLSRFGDYIDIQKPSFIDNISYLFEYQIGYMYWRYFMWNFVGRQNDNQGKYTDENGNWISGISFIDAIRLGNQDFLTSDDLKNKARNTYFFLPLIIGLIGLLFQLQYDRKNFWVLLLFFVFTGLALKVYLNERPFEPRERDYALVGSFYVFAIWIGFGVYGIYEGLKKYLSSKINIPTVLTLTFIAAPVLMASQNWDDHDRSNKYTAPAMAKMYLQSCKEDAILFTIGDNDTFALWYAQDIEEFRTDVRTINTSLFATDWYIDQMKRAAYDSKPIPSQLKHEFYRWGNNDAIYYQELTKDTLDIKSWMNWIESADKRTQAELQSGSFINTYPTKNVKIPVDKEAVIRNGIVAPEDAHLIVDEMVFHIKEDLLYKNRLLMLDILANNNWERPIYFTGGSFGDDDYLWMKDYLQLTGLTYQLVPIKTPLDKNNPFEMGRINSDQLYETVMQWDWGNSEDPNIYHDPETRKNAITYRSTLARLMENLINENKLEKAKTIIDLSLEKMPMEFYEYYTLIEPFISGYYQVGEKQKARDLWAKLAFKYQEKLAYYASLGPEKLEDEVAQRRAEMVYYNRFAEDIITQVERYRSVVDLLVINEDYALLEPQAAKFNEYLELFGAFYDKETEGYETDAINNKSSKLDSSNVNNEINDLLKTTTKDTLNIENL